MPGYSPHPLGRHPTRTAEPVCSPKSTSRRPGLRRQRIEISFRHVVLFVCAVLLAILVSVAGWTWPLIGAAVMIPLVAILMG